MITGDPSHQVNQISNIGIVWQSALVLDCRLHACIHAQVNSEISTPTSIHTDVHFPPSK